MSSPIILKENEYCHLVNSETGEVELVEGPQRFYLPSHKKIHTNVSTKTVLRKNQYVVVVNPFDTTKKCCLYGTKQVRVGPATFSCYPGENLGSIQDAEILTNSQAVIVKALRDFTDEKNQKRKAGELYMIRGPAVWIPKEYEQKIRLQNAITVSDNEAIYIRNTETSELKLVKGPTSYMLDVDEETYAKRLQDSEYEALGLNSKEPSFKAFNIQIQKNEVLCVVDYKKNTERFIRGPESHILGPYEGVKVLDISAGIPKRENQAKLACIHFGPDFMNDSFNVRTKDNAVLEVVLSYKWRFVVDDQNLYKLFESDFIGYACQSLRSRVREVASSHDFEKFHTNASEILRAKLFKEYQIPLVVDSKNITETHFGRFFKEFNLLIFELDVKKISPVDKEIDQLLNESIKASMEILCRKLNDTAATDAEKENIESEIEIAKLKSNLIEIENANYMKEVLEKAKIEGKALVEKAKAEMEAEKLLEQSRLNVELQSINETINSLKGKTGEKYIGYVKTLSLHKNVNNLVVLPTDTKSLFIPNNSQQPQMLEEY